MLSNYTKTTATYEKLSSTKDIYNEKDYDDGITIQCRKEKSTRIIQKSDEEVIKVKYIYYTTTEVNEGDKLDGSKIIEVFAMVDLNNKVIGYKAVV